MFIWCINHNIILLLLYVDEMIITSNDVHVIEKLKQFLRQQFEIKEFCPLSYFLILKVSLSSNGYYLTQVKYIFELISQADLIDNKIVDTPIKYNTRLNAHDKEPFRNATMYM